MTTLVLPRRLVTGGFVSMLQGNLTPDGVKVYTRPPTRDIPEMFVRVHDMGGGQPTGPPLLGDGADVCTRVQVDCVGRRHDQAQGLGDRVRTLVVSSDGAGGWVNAVTVSGWRCSSRSTAQFHGTRVEGQPGRELFVCRADYELDWTPA